MYLYPPLLATPQEAVVHAETVLWLLGRPRRDIFQPIFSVAPREKKNARTQMVECIQIY